MAKKKGEISSYGNSKLVPIDFHQETMWKHAI